jgi:hypothetical protein
MALKEKKSKENMLSNTICENLTHKLKPAHNVWLTHSISLKVLNCLPLSIKQFSLF